MITHEIICQLEYFCRHQIGYKQWYKVKELRDRVVSTPAFYSKTRGYKSRPQTKIPYPNILPYFPECVQASDFTVKTHLFACLNNHHNGKYFRYKLQILMRAVNRPTGVPFLEANRLERETMHLLLVPRFSMRRTVPPFLHTSVCEFYIIAVSRV